MEYTIYILGDYNFAHQVLNGVGALFSDNGAIWKMISVVGVLSLFYNFFMMPHKDKPGDPIKQFIFGILAVFILMGPNSKVSVRVESINTNQFHRVDNIPFIVGFGGYLTTGMMRELYNEYVWVFTSPDGSSVDNSVLRPLEAMSAIRNVNQDPFLCKLGSTSSTFNLCSSINAYMQNCYLRQLSAANSTMGADDEHEGSGKSNWASKKVHNVYWTTPSYLDETVTGDEISCPRAYGLLDGYMDYTKTPDGGHNLTEGMNKSLIKNGSNADDAAKLISKTFSAHVLSGGAAATAYDMMLAKFIKISELKAKATGLEPSLADVATFQAIEQRRVQMSSDRSLWMEMSVPLVTFFEAFAIFLAPIMAILMICGGNALTASLTYIGLFLWTAMWPIIMVLINLYTDYAMKGQFYASYGNGQNPIGFSSLDHTLVELESFLAQASVLVTLVPTLSLFVIYRGVHTMLSASGKAAPSTAIDSKLVSPDIASAANGGRYQQGANSGARTADGWNNEFNTGSNNVNFEKMSTQGSASSAASQMVSSAVQKQAAASAGYSSSVSEMFGTGGGITSTQMASEGSSTNTATAEQVMNTLSNGVVKATGWDKSKADKAVAAAAFSAGGSIPFIAKMAGSVSAQQAFSESLSKKLTGSKSDISAVSDSMSTSYAKVSNFSESGAITASETYAKNATDAESAQKTLSRADTDLEQAQKSSADMKAIATSMDVATQPIYNSLAAFNGNNNNALIDPSSMNSSGTFTGGFMDGMNVNDVHRQVFGGQPGYEDGSSANGKGALKDPESKKADIDKFNKDNYQNEMARNTGIGRPGEQKALGMQAVVKGLNEEFQGLEAGENRAGMAKGYEMSSKLWSTIDGINQEQSNMSFNADKLSKSYSDLSSSAGSTTADTSESQGRGELPSVELPAHVNNADLSQTGASITGQRQEQINKTSGANNAAHIGTGDAVDLLNENSQIPGIVNEKIADGPPIRSQKKVQNDNFTPEENENLENVDEKITAPKSITDVQKALAATTAALLDISPHSSAMALKNDGATQNEAVGMSLLAESNPDDFARVLAGANGAEDRLTSQFLTQTAAGMNSSFGEDFKKELTKDQAEDYETNRKALDTYLQGDTANKNDYAALGALSNQGIESNAVNNVLEKAANPNEGTLNENERRIVKALNNSFQEALGEGKSSNISEGLQTLADKSQVSQPESDRGLMNEIATPIVGSSRDSSQLGMNIVTAAVDNKIPSSTEASGLTERAKGTIASSGEYNTDKETISNLQQVANSFNAAGFTDAGGRLQDFVNNINGGGDGKTTTTPINPELNTNGRDTLDFDKNAMNSIMSSPPGTKFTGDIGDGRSQEFEVGNKTRKYGGIDGIMISDGTDEHKLFNNGSTQQIHTNADAAGAYVTADGPPTVATSGDGLKPIAETLNGTVPAATLDTSPTINVGGANVNDNSTVDLKQADSNIQKSIENSTLVSAGNPANTVENKSDNVAGNPANTVENKSENVAGNPANTVENKSDNVAGNGADARLDSSPTISIEGAKVTDNSTVDLKQGDSKIEQAGEKTPVASAETTPIVSTPVASAETTPIVSTPVASAETTPVVSTPVASAETTPVVAAEYTPVATPDGAQTINVGSANVTDNSTVDLKQGDSKIEQAGEKTPVAAAENTPVASTPVAATETTPVASAEKSVPDVPDINNQNSLRDVADGNFTSNGESFTKSTENGEVVIQGESGSVEQRFSESSIPQDVVNAEGTGSDAFTMGDGSDPMSLINNNKPSDSNTQAFTPREIEPTVNESNSDEDYK